MIITIDGPSASGKSSVARSLAHRLGYYYINTGFFYRSIGYIALNEHHYNSLETYDNDLSWLPLLSLNSIVYTWSSSGAECVEYNGVNITGFLKEPRIDTVASQLGSLLMVREKVTNMIRDIGKKQTCLIIDGRDAGTVLFPQADLKVFLTASESIRAERWRTDQFRKGILVSQSEAVHAIKERDTRDHMRVVAPLTIPNGAFIIDSSNLSFEQVVHLIWERCLHLQIHPL